MGSCTKRYFPQHQKYKFEGEAHNVNNMGPHSNGAPKFDDTGLSLTNARDGRLVVLQTAVRCSLCHSGVARIG